MTTAPSTFRQYQSAPPRVRENYRKARATQTVDFVDRMLSTHSAFDKRMDVWSILEQLNDLVDVSDPDMSHPNVYHAFQTAEAIRADGLPDWMQLIGLLHDVGKIMYVRGCDADGTSRNQQWAMVGDTFVVGCALPDVLVYPEYNHLNPDAHDPRYTTVCGKYAPGCGLDQVQCSWGHDEYLYRILASSKNPHTLPDEALYIVRFHSLYAYHRDGAYRELMDDKDRQMLPVLQQFNKYDLYSKSDDLLDIEALRPYYDTLMKKYLQRAWWWV
jgi:inositol oxygenase